MEYKNLEPLEGNWFRTKFAPFNKELADSFDFNLVIWEVEIVGGQWTIDGDFLRIFVPTEYLDQIDSASGFVHEVCFA